MKKIILVGQFPPPVTGEGKMNAHILNLLESDGWVVRFLNSCIVSSVDDVGKFSFRKMFSAISLYISFVFSLERGTIVYITPGQTLMGVIRFIPFVFFSKLCRLKLVLHWHGYGILQVFSKHKCLGRIFFNHKNTNLILTEDLKIKLSDIGIFINKTVVLKNFSELVTHHRSKIWAGKRLKVTYIGSLMKEKGADIFLDLAERNQDHDFFMCGSGSKELTLRAEALHDVGKINYMGLVDVEQKENLLLMSDVFVLQTNYLTEGVPLTILEAMSCGCAIVTTAHNGIPETVGDAALFIEPRSVGSLRDALDRLSNDSELLNVLKLNSTNRSFLFSKENFNRNIIRALENTIEGTI